MTVEASLREAALQAIEALLRAAFPNGTVERNAALPEVIDDFGHAVLYDGTGVSEVLVGSHLPIHSWLWNADLMLVAQHSEAATRSARLDSMLSQAAAMMIDNRYPVFGVHAAITSTVIDPVFQPTDGVMPISIATIGILLEYCTTNPTG